jgi:hypothetical protein
VSRPPTPAHEPKADWWTYLKVIGCAVAVFGALTVLLIVFNPSGGGGGARADRGVSVPYSAAASATCAELRTYNDAHVKGKVMTGTFEQQRAAVQAANEVEHENDTRLHCPDYDSW